MPDWRTLAQDVATSAPFLTVIMLGLAHGIRANTLYAITHKPGRRVVKIAMQFIGIVVLSTILYWFVAAIVWLLGYNVLPIAITGLSLALTFIGAIVLLRIPLTLTLNSKPIRPFKARDGAFEILLDRALVRETHDVFTRVMADQLAHTLAPGELDEMRSQLEPPELSGLPEEAAEEARRYWSTMLALVARKHPERDIPPTILDHAAEAALAAVERLREASHERVQRAIILAKFIDNSEEGSIPITAEESRRHPLYMRLGGLHAYLWGTVATVITTSSVAVAVEQPRTQIAWARDLAAGLRRDIGKQLSGTWFSGAENLVARPMENVARDIDMSINTVATELVATANLLLQRNYPRSLCDGIGGRAAAAGRGLCGGLVRGLFG